MGLVVVPIIAEKVNDWKSWNKVLATEKKGDFDDMNKRYGLTRHDVWFVESPAGALAVVLHEGPGSDTFMPKIAQSENPFDVWMRESIESFHNMDLGAPPPGPMPVEMM